MRQTICLSYIMCVNIYTHVFFFLTYTHVYKKEVAEGNLEARGRGRLRKAKGKTIKNDLEANDFTIDMIHDKQRQT